MATSPQRRTINAAFFSSLSEESAYLLGQLKAGANFLKNQQDNSFYIRTNDLHQLIKIQTLLRSDHVIYFIPRTGQYNLKIYSFELCSTLKREYSFLRTDVDTPTKNAPFLELSSKLMPHYIRGYLDERGCFSRNAGGRVQLAITGSNLGFLNSLDAYLVNVVSCSHGSICAKETRTKAGPKQDSSFNLVYSREQAVSDIFQYIYSEANTHILCTNKYMHNCKVLDIEPKFKQFILELDVITLRKLHRWCVDNQTYSQQIHDYVDKSIVQYLSKEDLLPIHLKELISSSPKQPTFDLKMKQRHRGRNI